jgi:hypothetical protein
LDRRFGHIVTKRLITTVAVQVEAANDEYAKETSEVFEAAMGCNEKEVPSQKELGFPKGAQGRP